jgi:hypothetical protein
VRKEVRRRDIIFEVKIVNDYSYGGSLGWVFYNTNNEELGKGLGRPFIEPVTFSTSLSRGTVLIPTSKNRLRKTKLIKFHYKNFRFKGLKEIIIDFRFEVMVKKEFSPATVHLSEVAPERP